MVETDLGIDIARLQSWIGREEEANDILTPRLVESLHATFDSSRHFPRRARAMPAMLHWCLTPMIAPHFRLGPDGHPARGSFLPPVPLPRRMWAGSDIEFLAPLVMGDTITRRSRIATVEMKKGKTGSLIFVNVDHHYSTVRGDAVRDLQTIVYLPSESRTSAPESAAKSAAPDEQCLVMRANSAMLARYCGLLFNSHRIHFDRSYAMNEEHYAGLVVHGPLQASLLAEFAAELHGAEAPCRFSFRGLAPLFDDADFSLRAKLEGDVGTLRILDNTGRTTMQAKAEW